MSAEEEKEGTRSRDMVEFSKEWEAPVDVESFAQENKEFREKHEDLVDKVEEIKEIALLDPDVKPERHEVIENGIWRMVESFDGKPGDEAVEKLWDVFKRYGDRDPTAMVKGFGFEALVLSHELDDERVVNADAAIFVEGKSEDEVYQEFVHSNNKQLSENLRFERLSTPEGGPELSYQVVTVAEARDKEIESRRRLLDLKKIEEYCRQRLEQELITEEERKQEVDKWSQEVIEGKVGPGNVREWQVVKFSEKEIVEMRLETWGIMEKGPVVGKIIRQGFIDANDRQSGSEPLGFGGYFTMPDKVSVERCRTAEDLGEHPFFIYLPQEDSGFKLRTKLDNAKVPYAAFDNKKGEWVIRNMGDGNKYSPKFVEAIAALLNHRNKELSSRMVVPDGVITQRVKEGMIDNAVGIVEAKCWAKAEVDAVLTHLRPLSVEQAVSIGGKLHTGAILAHWEKTGERPPAYITDFLNMYIEIEKEIEYLKRSGSGHMHKRMFAVLRVPNDVSAKQATELQLNFLRFGLRYVQVQRMPYASKEVEAMSTALVGSQFLKEKLKEEFDVQRKRDITLSANISLRCKLENVDHEQMDRIARKVDKETESGLSPTEKEFYLANKEIVDDQISLQKKKRGGGSKKKKDKANKPVQSKKDYGAKTNKDSDQKPAPTRVNPLDLENSQLERKRKWRR